jgi:outer membrane receptor protein involved in Fe transport
VLLGSTALSLLLPAAAAHAAATAPAEGSSIEEVVVTANKRGVQAVLDTPAAVQAITGDTLARQGVSGIIDIATKIPGLQLQDLGPGDKKYVIRGVNSTGASTTGVYYDEAVISANNPNDGGGREADIRLYDLDHVEVLRGPQGTLYGASSESGTIRFITRKPDMEEFGGYVTGEVSTTHKGAGNYDANGAVNIPLIKDLLALRLTGWTINDSGYIDQVRTPPVPRDNVNSDQTAGLRAQLKYTPTDRLSLLGAITVQDTDSHGSSRYTPPSVMSFSAPGYPSIPGGDLVNTDLTLSPWHDHLDVYSLTAEYRLDIGTITATTNKFTRDIDFGFDSSPILFFFGVPIPAQTLEPQSRDLWSDEVRFASAFDGPFNFVAGAFYQREVTDLTVNVIKTDVFGRPIGVFSPRNEDDALTNPDGNTFFGRTDHRVDESKAVFGEATWDVTDKAQLIGGVRYFTEDIHGVQETTHPFGGFTASPVGPQANADSFSKTTFKVTGKYSFSPALMLYATASQGFRGGGVNPANLPFASGIPHGFEPDSLWNYEVGAKGRLFDNRFFYELAAYLINWDNIQVQEVDATGAFPFTSNAGSARIKGLEAEFEYHPTPELTFSLNGSYQDAYLTEDQPPIPGNPNVGHKGDELPKVPKLQGNLTADYVRPINEQMRARLAADFSYRGKTHTQLNEASPFNVPLAAYTLVNLRAGVETDEWSATLFVRNLTDNRAQIDAISSSQDPLARITVRPRTIGVTLTRTF